MWIILQNIHFFEKLFTYIQTQFDEFFLDKINEVVLNFNCGSGPLIEEIQSPKLDILEHIESLFIQMRRFLGKVY